MKRLFHTLFITLLFTFAVNCSYANSEPLVITDIGAIEGVSEHGVEHFYGIPYAKAPVHDLRFAPTVAADPLEQVITLYVLIFTALKMLKKAISYRYLCGYTVALI